MQKGAKILSSPDQFVRHSDQHDLIFKNNH